MRKYSTLVTVLASWWLGAPRRRGRAARNLLSQPAGQVTLKCDFHTHTVFSDGNVWPTVRVDEAWREGLDAIAVTDHIEYRPHKDDLGDKLNRSYELMTERARSATFCWSTALS